MQACLTSLQDARVVLTAAGSTHLGIAEPQFILNVHRQVGVMDQSCQRAEHLSKGTRAWPRKGDVLLVGWYRREAKCNAQLPFWSTHGCTLAQLSAPFSSSGTQVQLF